MSQSTSRARRFLGRFLLAFTPALLLGVYARFPALAFVPYFALVPWVMLYTSPGRERVSAAWYVVASLVAWNVIFWPQTSRYGWYASPAMSLFLGAFWVVYPFLMGPIHRRFALPRVLSFPVVWVATEWLRVTLTLGNFDLHLLGYSQARFTPLVQVADLTGVYGVSFLVAAVNGWIADLWFAHRERGGLGSGLRSPSVRWGAAGLAAGFAGFWGYGAYRLATAVTEPGPRVAIVQPNVRHTNRNALGVHLSQVLLSDRLVPDDGADLIVWPENAILDNVRREGVYLEDLSWLGSRKGAWILLGGMGKSKEIPGRTTNSAYLIDPRGEIRGEYRKQVLFPWSEFVPFDDALRRFSPTVWRFHRTLIRGAWGYLAPGVAGEGMTLLEMPWANGSIPMAALICGENTYPPVPSEAARMGARLFVNITSEGEAEGAGIQEQLLRICIVRAVENRIPYVRCGNTGISAFIDPQGRRRSLLRGERGRAISDAGVLIDRPLLSPRGPTIYALSRDAFALACVAVTAALLVAALATRRKGAGTAAAILALLAASACGGSPEIGEDRGRAREALTRGTEGLRDGDASRAVATLASACADEAACREAIPLLVEALDRSQQTEIGMRLFREIASRHPSLAGTALGFRGFFSERSLDLVAAEASYREALRVEPSARVYGRLGALLIRTDDLEGAVEALDAATRLAPSDPELRYTRNRALWLAGRIDRAREDLEAAVLDHPGHGPTWALLGRVRDLAGDRVGAEVAWRRAILAEPANREARFMLARRALRLERMDEARAWLREILAIEAGLGRGPAEG